MTKFLAKISPDILSPGKVWKFIIKVKNLTFRFLPIHEYAKILGEEVCRGLPLWFAFTGCDTVSTFSGRGKKTAWNAWKSFRDVTQAFVRYIF